MDARIEPRKDQLIEHPVPEAWRDTFRSIVDCFVDLDYRLERSVDGVRPIAEDTATQIKEYIKDYGERLAPLSEDTWNSSVSRWMGDHWVVLVDLCTESEGISDLILHSLVKEDRQGFSFEIYMVYVP